MTAGCIVDTSATDGSLRASVRYVSQSARVDSDDRAPEPALVDGSDELEQAGVAESIEVGTVEVAALLPLGALGGPRRCDLCDCVRHGRHGS